jgi:hypothetical protein
MSVAGADYMCDSIEGPEFELSWTGVAGGELFPCWADSILI